MPHPNCKPSNPQPPPVPRVAHPSSQGWPPNQRHSYEPEQWSKPRMPYQEVLPPEPHPQPSGPPSLSGYPVDHTTPHTPHSTQYYKEMYEEPPSNPSELDDPMAMVTLLKVALVILGLPIPSMLMAHRQLCLVHIIPLGICPK